MKKISLFKMLNMKRIVQKKKMVVIGIIFIILSTVSSSTPSKFFPSDEELPVHAVLLTYINGPNITKSEFAPVVAYMENGQIKDTMFDSFVFLPSPNFLYGRGKYKELKKSDWQGYMDSVQFAKNVNLDALEMAVEDTKTALGRNYKVNVFMTVLPPIKTVMSFGEINGKNLCFSDLDDRKAAVRWMVDEQIRQFEARNYKNLHLAGFYWHLESMSFVTGWDGKPGTDPQISDVVKYLTSYIRALGYKTMWIPCYNAPGWNSGKEHGFDLSLMQANYFPARPNSPNCGPISRLADNAVKTKSFGYGFELELHGGINEEAAITGFKQYMKVGVEQGYMNNSHNAYYINHGPVAVRELYDANDPYIHSTYNELYRFIKRTLKVSDILINE